MKRVVFQSPREKHPAFGTIWRPVIEVAFRYGRYRIRTDALVDPGADITLLPKRLGDALHLNLNVLSFCDNLFVCGFGRGLLRWPGNAG